MDGLGNYGSDEDSQEEGDHCLEEPIAPPKIEFKLPSLSDLLSSASPSSGPGSFKRKVEIDDKDLDKSQKEKQQKVVKNNLFRPPQLTRPNIITEDYRAWSGSAASGPPASK
jgi:hypothetical protein